VSAAGAEQRRHQRRDVDISIHLSLDSDSQFFIYQGLNVSRGGLFIACEPPLVVGTALRVRFVLPGWELHPVETDAVVRWIRTDPPGVGLEFVELSSTARLMIEEFTADRGGALLVPGVAE